MKHCRLRITALTRLCTVGRVYGTDMFDCTALTDTGATAGFITCGLGGRRSLCSLTVVLRIVLLPCLWVWVCATAWNRKYCTRRYSLADGSISPSFNPKISWPSIRQLTTSFWQRLHKQPECFSSQVLGLLRTIGQTDGFLTSEVVAWHETLEYASGELSMRRCAWQWHVSRLLKKI